MNPVCFMEDIYKVFNFNMLLIVKEEINEQLNT